MEKIKNKINEIKTIIQMKWANVTILDKYIIKQLLEVFMLGVIIFTSIIFASELFTQLINQIARYGIPFNIAIMMTVLNLPQVFVMTIPISMLFATVMTINRLSLNSEITVLKACGIGISRIAKPVFALAIVMTALSLFINEVIVPATSKQAKLLVIYSLQKKHVPNGKRNYTLKELSDGRVKRIFYVQECKDKRMENVTVLDVSNKDTIQLIQAEFGTSNFEGWNFNNAVAYTISTTEKILNTTIADKFTVNFGIDNIGAITEEKASQYTYFKLLKHINKNKRNEEFKKKFEKSFRVNLHDKVALPMTTLALTLVGIPLAITPPRVRYNRGFLFSIMIIFIYYLVRAISLNVGEAGTLPPFFAAWLPVVIIFIIGLILYKRKAYRI